MLGIAIGAASAISSLVGDALEASDAKKQKADAIAAMRKLLIPSNETEARADRAGDTLYTKTMSELNSGAFAARGALNPETLRTIAYTKMAGSRAETEFNVAEDDMKYNRGINEKIAGIEATPTPTLNPMNAIGAGISGYFTGKQLEMSQSLSDQYASYAQMQTAEIKQRMDNPNYFGSDTNNIMIEATKPSYDSSKGFMGKILPQEPMDYNNPTPWLDKFSDLNYGFKPPKKMKRLSDLNFK